MLTIVLLSLKGRITKGEILQMVRNWEILERKQVHQVSLMKTEPDQDI